MSPGRCCFVEKVFGRTKGSRTPRGLSRVEGLQEGVLAWDQATQWGKKAKKGLTTCHAPFTSSVLSGTVLLLHVWCEFTWPKQQWWLFRAVSCHVKQKQLMVWVSGRSPSLPFTPIPLSKRPDTQAINSLLQQTQLEAKLAEERDSHENAEAEIEEVRCQLVLQSLFDCLMHCTPIFKLPG